VRLGEAQVVAERVLRPEIADAPGTHLQVLDDAVGVAGGGIRGVDVGHGDHDLDAVAALRGLAEASEVPVVADRLGAAPQHQHAGGAGQHEVVIAAAAALGARDAETEAAIEALGPP